MTAPNTHTQRGGNESGAAALEATLYAFAVIVPMIWLTWYVWTVGAIKHNAVAGARHGAVRASMAGWAHYGDDKDETSSGYEISGSKVEQETLKYIAYVPAVTGSRVLKDEGGGFLSGEMKVQATVQSNMPILDFHQLGETESLAANAAKGQLVIKYRDPKLYAPMQLHLDSMFVPGALFTNTDTGSGVPAAFGPAHITAWKECMKFISKL